ncbi:MAG: 30S ribosomal protein S21 [Phycisphaerales bacterium]|jgi:small subunit ribosomal protein S21|nr:30S ribosomal protein S21 [Phycisphaerales bacterium]
MAIKVKARGGETVEQMVRRFKKLCEKDGLTKEVKRRQYYEKPSEIKRRAAIRRAGPRPLLGRPGSRPGSPSAAPAARTTGGRSGSGSRSGGGREGGSGGGGGRSGGRGA